ncbi:MAG: hypothetical protein ACYCSP_16690, partial [Acidobacteriaceae bacterium]
MYREDLGYSETDPLPSPEPEKSRRRPSLATVDWLMRAESPHPFSSQPIQMVIAKILAGQLESSFGMLYVLRANNAHRRINSLESIATEAGLGQSRRSSIWLVAKSIPLEGN